MKVKSQKRKKSTIFRLFLVPLIAIMLIQSIITFGTLVVRRTAGMLEEYSGGMMNRLVENRKLILQNDMNQLWASVYEREASVNASLKQYLTSNNTNLEEVLGSDEMKNELLKLLFPECLNILQNSSTTGVFLILTGADMQAAGEFDGFLSGIPIQIQILQIIRIYYWSGGANTSPENGIFRWIQTGPPGFIWMDRETILQITIFMSHGEPAWSMKMQTPVIWAIGPCLFLWRRERQTLMK